MVTGARRPVTLGGAAAVVVHPDSLPISPAPSLEQALRHLPFILVRRNSRGEAELSIRGSESRQVAVLLDGVPLSLGWDHRTDPSLVPLTGARRLERSWRLGKGGGGARSLRATVGVENVTNETVYDQCGLPRPGRTLLAGLSLRW